MWKVTLRKVVDNCYVSTKNKAGRKIKLVEKHLNSYMGDLIFRERRISRHWTQFITGRVSVNVWTTLSLQLLALTAVTSLDDLCSLVGGSGIILREVRGRLRVILVREREQKSYLWCQTLVFVQFLIPNMCNLYRCYWSCCLVAQLCPALCDLRDYIACQTPLSMGFPKARILEWVAIPFSRGSSPPRDWTHVSFASRQILHLWVTREALDIELLKT